MSKTIVAVGCSHVFGSYLNSNDMFAKEECNQRSWVKKLGNKYFPTDNVVNLAAPGGSNARSFRVIKEYILDNLENASNLIVFFGITDLSRLELVTEHQIEGPAVDFFANKSYIVNIVGPWCRVPMKDVQTYLDVHYGVFYNDTYETEKINLDLLTLHIFLKHYGIEHYFVNMLAPQGIVNKDYNLPLIDFGGIIQYAKKFGYKVGKDLHPEIDCNHLDHDGNEFLAEKIYEKMKGIKDGT